MVAAQIDISKGDLATAPSRPDAPTALRLFEAFFLARTDVLPLLVAWTPDKIKPCPADRFELQELISAHVLGAAAPRAKARLVIPVKKDRTDTSRERKTRQEWRAGHYRVGSYCPTQDGERVKWTCLDFDGGGHSAPLADARGTALVALQRARELQLPAYLEQSGGGRGWHLWIFFAEPTSLEQARELGFGLAPRDARLENGELADPDANQGVEVFPKQRTRGLMPLGNMVWLPWWHGAADGGNLFYRAPEPGDPSAAGLAPFIPDAFDTVAPAALARALEHLQAQAAAAPGLAPSTALVRQAGAPGSPQTAALAAATPRSIAPQEWKEWRTKALEALPLESVYGAWLTNESMGDWLKCRDPDSPSGDQNPSAGVATGTGEAERGTFHSFRTSETQSVFDFMVAHQLAADVREAFRRVAELSHVAFPKRDLPDDAALALWVEGFLAPGPGDAPPPDSQPPGAPPNEPKRYPRIRVNDRQLREIISETWVHVHTDNTRDGRDPSLFRRMGRLARLRDEDGLPKIDLMGPVDIYGHVARIANWVNETKDGYTNVFPPKPLAPDLVSSPDSKLPRLDAIVHVPIFDEHGKLVTTPGYHPKSFLWLHLDPSFKMDPIPEAPSPADVAAARALILDELLTDFPFADQSDRAHAVAMLVQPFVRRLIRGNTPIVDIEAPTPGSGKTLLADQVSILAEGRNCTPLTLTNDEDEIRKKISSALIASKNIILFDNVKDNMDSGQIAAAITADVWSDRSFNKQSLLEVPNRALWVITANNPSLSDELARRSIRCRLDTKSDKPHKRKNFKHKALRKWVLAHRAELVRAILTLAQAWLVAGRPAPRVDPLGSFESWTEVVGGILQYAGIEGFLANQDEFFELADVTGAEWREFINLWHRHFGQNLVKPGKLAEIVEAENCLSTVLSTGRNAKGRATKLGLELRHMTDKQFHQWRIVGGEDKKNGGQNYMLVPAYSDITSDKLKDPQRTFDDSNEGPGHA